MQKQVSKHRLSILALSILLVLSLALTATFAAFGANASATGTVSFQGAFQIRSAASGAGDDLIGTPSGKTIAVTIALADGGVTFTGNLADVYVNAGSGSSAPFFWKVTLADTSSTDYFDFDTTDQPSLNSKNASATATQIVWKNASNEAATSEEHFDIEALLEGIEVTLKPATLAAATGTPQGELTLTIELSYVAF